MINPAGDAQHPGRKIGDTFERTLTLAYAQRMHQEIMRTYPHTQVVLTRTAGETISSLQNANFANRLNVDIFVSIHFYQETDVKPTLYLYNFSYNDDFITHKQDLSFCRYDQAHLYNYSITRHYGHVLKQALATDTYTPLFTCMGCYKAPIKPCIGIKAPALLIEVGLRSADDWQGYVEPLVIALKPIIEKMQNS